MAEKIQVLLIAAIFLSIIAFAELPIGTANTIFWSNELQYLSSPGARNASSSDHPPVFISYNVSQEEGDTETGFILLCEVYDPDGIGIVQVSALVGGTRFVLVPGAQNNSYWLETSFPKGEHQVHFEAVNWNGTKNDTLADPLFVKVKQKEEDQSDTIRYICLGIVIVGTILLMLWTIRSLRKRAKSAESTFEDQEDAYRIKCTNCGKPVDERDVECPHCGEYFEGVEEICPFCDSSVPRGASRCPLCKKKFKPNTKKGKTTDDKKKMECPECGAVVDLGTKICPGCDHSFGKERSTLRTKKGKKAEKQGEVFMCSICGGDVTEKESKCPDCGAEFG